MEKDKPKKNIGKSVKATDMPDLTRKFSLTQLGDALRAKRTGMGLKLVDLSTLLGISKPTLIKLEKGSPGFKFDNLLTVMEFLGLSFSIKTDSVNNLTNESGNDNEQWY